METATPPGHQLFQKKKLNKILRRHTCTPRLLRMTIEGRGVYGGCEGYSGDKGYEGADALLLSCYDGGAG